MKVYKIFLILTFISFNNQLFSQETKEISPDPRLKSYYSETQLEKMINQAPAMIEYMNFFLDNAYFIQDIPAGKNIEGESIVIEDYTNININALGLKRSQTNRTFYKIKGTNKMLVCYSNEEFTKMFNEHTGRLK